VGSRRATTSEAESPNRGFQVFAVFMIAWLELPRFGAPAPDFLSGAEGSWVMRAYAAEVPVAGLVFGAQPP